MSINKAKCVVLRSIRSRLEDMLATAKQAVLDAQEEANHHVGAMESRYDTFKEEAQYLATAQTIRTYQIQAQIDECNRLIKRISGTGIPFSKVESGALVIVANDHAPLSQKIFFVVPDGTGNVIAIGERQAICVTVDAPVLKPFIGLREGDYCEFFGDDKWAENAYIESIT